MQGKLTVKIQEPTLGKGWYTATVNPRHTIETPDEELVAYSSSQPGLKVTGVQIIREYKLA